MIRPGRLGMAITVPAVLVPCGAAAAGVLALQDSRPAVIAFLLSLLVFAIATMHFIMSSASRLYESASDQRAFVSGIRQTVFVLGILYGTYSLIRSINDGNWAIASLTLTTFILLPAYCLYEQLRRPLRRG